ncbi:ribonuclease Z [Rhodocaloribacter litoris]|uniref:ribonuclease Z n=1 Tax=Rhodocaloribacter litoris TaxID=2558931 RepID=UPI0014227C1E|nr:ribonuclease Z [Rhodocaloribacter litoris]QXD16484.1 ribonuclease Z [Rhodocaloribacter litoris]GIV59449.1 MAG: ribonuclease Z [Rhodothermaceae bacterium]
MQTEIIPLGTASAMPVRGRHFSALVLRHGGHALLFDCGEGTQLQMVRAGLISPRLDAIFITHFHGDHFYGLPGLLATMSMLRYQDGVTVVGPKGLAAALDATPGLDRDWLSFDVDFVELREDFGQATVFETETYVVTARPLVHNVFTIGYRFEAKPRPGRLDVEAARARGVTDYVHYRRLKAGHDVTLPGGEVVRAGEVVGPPRPGPAFAYVTDTRPCEAARLLARDVDVLYHEATFGEAHRDRALETMHATAREAAAIARDAGARRLLLGHFSARYADPAPLVAEARAVFENTEAAEELRRYPLKRPDPTPEPRTHAPATGTHDATGRGRTGG